MTAGKPPTAVAVERIQFPRSQCMDHQVDQANPSSTGEVAVNKGISSEEHPETHSTASTLSSRTLLPPQPTEVVSSRVLVNLSGSNVNLYTGNPYYALNTPSNPLEVRVDLCNPTSGQQLHRDQLSSNSPSQNLGTIRHEEVGFEASNRIYERHMLTRGRGYPLWIPEGDLNLPIEKKRMGVSIGDVGMITSLGSFSYLFNILLPANHPLQPEEMPEGYTPIAPLGPTSLFHANEFKKNSALTSISMKKLETPDINDSEATSTEQKFELLASEGAVLALPEGAQSCQLQKQLLGWRRYMAAHIESWYRYVIGTLECEIKNGDIRLVIGSDQTTFWGTAVAEHPTSSPDKCLLRFRPSPLSINNPERYTWDYNGVVTPRTGPSRDEVMQFGWDMVNKSQNHPNQCIFVRSLNMALSDAKWAQISEEFELGQWLDSDAQLSSHSHPSSSFSPGRNAPGPSYQAPPSTSTQNQKSHTRMYTDNHPADLVNQMLLALAPQAWAAIANDDDWCNSRLHLLAITRGRYDPRSMLCCTFLGASIQEEDGIVSFKIKPVDEEFNDPMWRHWLRDIAPYGMMEEPLEVDTYHIKNLIVKLIPFLEALIEFCDGVEVLKHKNSTSVLHLEDSGNVWRWPFLDKIILPALDRAMGRLQLKPEKPPSPLTPSSDLPLESAEIVASRGDLKYGTKQEEQTPVAGPVAAFDAYRGFRRTCEVEGLKACTEILRTWWHPEPSTVDSSQVAKAEFDYGTLTPASGWEGEPQRMPLAVNPPSYPELSPLRHFSAVGSQRGLSENVGLAENQTAGFGFQKDIPELEACFALLTETYATVNSVKICKQQCHALIERCRVMLGPMRDRSHGPNISPMTEAAAEMDFIIRIINREITEWGSWSKLRTFLQQRQIKNAIEELSRDLDGVIMKFSIGTTTIMNENIAESQRSEQQQQSELKELLQSIVSDKDVMDGLHHMKPRSDSHPIREITEALQTVLKQPDLLPAERKTLAAGLQDLQTHHVGQQSKQRIHAQQDVDKER